MTKELWFRAEHKQRVLDGSLTRTFRDLPKPGKNNNYAVGDSVRCRIHDGSGNFDVAERVIVIDSVEVRDIGSLASDCFAGGGVASKDELVSNLARYYGREFTDADLVRMIDFHYLT